MDIQQLVNDPKATIIDVRETYEYAAGAVNGSVNIPLGQIPGKVEEFKGMEKPLIFCCASGNRSGQAAGFLQAQGVEGVYNGGSWAMVDAMKMHTV